MYIEIRACSYICRAYVIPTHYRNLSGKMCCSAFSPEKKNGKRGFNMMVINGKLFVTNTVCCNSVHSGIIIQVITVASYCSEISCNVK